MVESMGLPQQPHQAESRAEPVDASRVMPADVYRALQARLDNYRQVIGGVVAAVLAVVAVLLGAIFRLDVCQIETAPLVIVTVLVMLVGGSGWWLISREMQPHFCEMAGIVQKLELLSNFYEDRYPKPKLAKDGVLHELDRTRLGPLLPGHWREFRISLDTGEEKYIGWADPFIRVSGKIIVAVTLTAMVVLLGAVGVRTGVLRRLSPYVCPPKSEVLLIRDVGWRGVPPSCREACSRDG